MIDPTKVEYKLVLERDGEDVILNDIITDCTWSDTEGIAVGKMEISFVYKYLENLKIYTDELVSNGDVIKLYYEGILLNRFKVRSHRTRLECGGNSFSVSLSDRMFNFSKVEESWYYEKGMSTESIIRDIFARGETDLIFDYPSTTHEAIFTKSKTLLDEVSDIMDEAYEASGTHKPILIMDGTTARITSRGYNEEIYQFYRTDRMTDKGNILSFDRSASIEDIVTRVHVYGKELSENHYEHLANYDGHTEFDILQKEVYMNTEETEWDVKRRAKRILAESGEQVITYTLTTPDVPVIRKGHKINLKINENLDGYFYVLSCTHNLANRTMTMKIESESDDSKIEISLSPEEEQAEREFKEKQKNGSS